MAEAIVQVSPDSTGKKIRAVENTVEGNLVEQQVVSLAKADGTLVDLHADLEQIATNTAPVLWFMRPAALPWFMGGS